MAKRRKPQPPTSLYRHKPPLKEHQPRHANERHAEQRQAHAAAKPLPRLARFNLALAVWLTKHTGSMACAYLFFGIGMGSLIGVLTNSYLLAALCGSISSYVLQLVLLPVLAVGQNVLSQHAEIQADEQFKATMRSLHESHETIKHLNAQDRELLKQTSLLVQLLQALVPGATTDPSEPTPELTPEPTPELTPASRPRGGQRVKKAS